MTTNNEETLYTATFELSQTGLEGDVRASLRLNPTPEGDEDVLVHDQMVAIAYSYLHHMGMVDDEGKLIPEDTDGGLAPSSTTKQ